MLPWAVAKAQDAWARRWRWPVQRLEFDSEQIRILSSPPNTIRLCLGSQIRVQSSPQHRQGRCRTLVDLVPQMSMERQSPPPLLVSMFAGGKTFFFPNLRRSPEEYKYLIVQIMLVYYSSSTTSIQFIRFFYIYK